MVTTEFAPTTDPSPIVTSGKMTAPVPIQASESMVIEPLREFTYGTIRDSLGCVCNTNVTRGEIEARSLFKFGAKNPASVLSGALNKKPELYFRQPMAGYAIIEQLESIADMYKTLCILLIKNKIV